MDWFQLCDPHEAGTGTWCIVGSAAALTCAAVASIFVRLKTDD